MSAFDLIIDQVAGLRARMDRERTTLRLGTVQSSGTVLLTDGAEVTPAARLTDTATGDIVLVGQHNRRAYVLGKRPTPTPPQVWTATNSDLTSPFTLRSGNYPQGARRAGNVVTLQLQLAAASPFTHTSTVLADDVIPPWARPSSTVTLNVAANMTLAANQIPNGEMESSGRMRLFDLGSTASTPALKIYGTYIVD